MWIITKSYPNGSYIYRPSLYSKKFIFVHKLDGKIWIEYGIQSKRLSIPIDSDVLGKFKVSDERNISSAIIEAKRFITSNRTGYPRDM